MKKKLIAVLTAGLLLSGCGSSAGTQGTGPESGTPAAASSGADPASFKTMGDIYAANPEERERGFMDTDYCYVFELDGTVYRARGTLTEEQRDALFDLQGRVLIDFYPRCLTGKQNHAATMGNRNAGCNVCIEKQLFNGNCIRLEQLKQLKHILIDLFQTTGQAGMGRRRNHTALYQLLFVLLRIYNPKADGSNSRINTQYTHKITSKEYFNIQTL